MMAEPSDNLPGFRRRFRIEAEPGAVRSWLEDDFHCMTVRLRHDGGTIRAVASETVRAPWNTCPGAEAVLRETFIGAALTEAAKSHLKRANCTHLYDLAVLAAAHAGDAAPLTYDVFVSDPVDGISHAEIRRDSVPVMRWTLGGTVLTQPAELAGRSLFELRDWIAALDPARREAARILQWACLIAHGRQLPLDQQSDATRMPPNCYTFQPDVARTARRIGETVDFSRAGREPLETIRPAKTGETGKEAKHEDERHDDHQRRRPH